MQISCFTQGLLYLEQGDKVVLYLILFYHFILSFYPRSASRTAARQASSTPALDEHSLASSNLLGTGSKSYLFKYIFNKLNVTIKHTLFRCDSIS